MKVVKGDLIKLAKAGEFDVILHGCNCFHLMGAGVAKQIKEHFPEAYEADVKQAFCGDIQKLGDISQAAVWLPERPMPLLVVNAYTQFMPGANADYAAIRSCFRRIANYYGNRRIGYPKIGAGIGGGDWNLIAPIIDEALEGCDHTLVVL